MSGVTVSSCRVSHMHTQLLLQSGGYSIHSSAAEAPLGSVCVCVCVPAWQKQTHTFT